MLKLKLIPLPAAIVCGLTLQLIFYSVEAISRTESFRVEMGADIRIFEIYLDLMESSPGDSSFQKINEEDDLWKKASKGRFNTISAVKYKDGGSIIMANDHYHFQIIFIPTITDSRMAWKCQIEKMDGSPYGVSTCDSWKKTIKDPKLH